MTTPTPPERADLVEVGAPSAEPADDTGHIAVTHPGGCDNWACMFCVGGLWACTICGGLEGSMPSTCPGQQMDAGTIDAVYNGAKDFRDGGWVDECSRFSPARWKGKLDPAEVYADAEYRAEQHDGHDPIERAR